MENGDQPPDQVPAPAWASTVRMLQESLGSLASNLATMNQAISQNADYMNNSLASINASMTSNAQQMASVEQMGNRIVSLEEKTQGKFPKFSVLHLSLFILMFHLCFMHVLTFSFLLVAINRSVSHSP